jgi:hypothetical protein
MANITIIELDDKAGLYAVVDERGRTLGTGSREDCEMLALVMNQPIARPERQHHLPSRISRHDNIRSAIKI